MARHILACGLLFKNAALASILCRAKGDLGNEIF